MNITTCLWKMLNKERDSINSILDKLKKLRSGKIIKAGMNSINQIKLYKKFTMSSNLKILIKQPNSWVLKDEFIYLFLIKHILMYIN